MTQDYKIWQVISASSVGTTIEWYDFYIFGSLATVIAPLFYPQGNSTLALTAYLSTFAVGFVVAHSAHSSLGASAIGGLLPLIGLTIIAQTGNIYAGLYYPIAVPGLTFVVGSLLQRETRHVLIWEELKE